MIRPLLLAVALVSPWITAGAGIAYEPGGVVRDDGARIAYYERKGSGPCVVLIPGSWDNHHAFDAMVAAMDPDSHVVVVELRGHGKSVPPAESPDMALFARDVFAVADAIGLPAFWAGGHSIGGMIAIEMAGQRPGALRGVISIEGWTHHTVIRDAFDGDLTSTLTAEENALREANREATQASMTPDRIKAFGSVWRTWNGDAILETTSLPVLQVWGDRGKSPPGRAALRIPDRPNIAIEWIEGASHWLLIEEPAAVATAVNAFVGNSGTGH